MSILVDRQIRKLALEGMIQPFEPKMLNPASLDIRVGDTAVLETSRGQKDINLWEYSKSKAYGLLPGECVLVASLEIFNMPSNVAGEFKLKSSRGREFYQHMLAGWIEPDFHNSVLTMEIKNAHPYNVLPLYPGLRIGQIIFYQLAEVPEKSYKQVGRYNNDLAVAASKG